MFSWWPAFGRLICSTRCNRFLTANIAIRWTRVAVRLIVWFRARSTTCSVVRWIESIRHEKNYSAGATQVLTKVSRTRSEPECRKRITTTERAIDSERFRSRRASYRRRQNHSYRARLMSVNLRRLSVGKGGTTHTFRKDDKVEAWRKSRVF